MFSFIVPFFLVGIVSSYDLTDRFNSWSIRHNVSFYNDEHYMNTFNNWYENDNYIQSYNAENSGSMLAHNQFSGMSSDEFRGFLGNYKKKRNGYVVLVGVFRPPVHWRVLISLNMVRWLVFLSSNLWIAISSETVEVIMVAMAG